MASRTRWMWVWVNSGSWWWTGRPGVLRFMGSQCQTRLSDWTELNWLNFLQNYSTISKTDKVYLPRGFPGGAGGEEPTGQCRRLKRHGFSPWVGKTPWRRNMATHPSILAWRIPRTEEPGELQSIVLQRVGHDWSSLACRPESRCKTFLLVKDLLGSFTDCCSSISELCDWIA